MQFLNTIIHTLFIACIIGIHNTAHSQIAHDEGVDLRPLMYPVKNQGKHGACVIFAYAAALETFPGVPRISETESYIQYQLKEGAFDKEGVNLEKFTTFLNNGGKYSFKQETPTNEFSNNYHLISSLISVSTSSNCTEIVKSRAMRSSIQSLEGNNYFFSGSVKHLHKESINSQLIIDALRRNQPVLLSLKIINKEWARGYTDPRFEYRQNDTTTTTKWENDEHAVLVVGYSKNKSIYGSNEFIIRNSWGTRWGDDGYGYISEERLFAMISSGILIEQVFNAKSSYSSFRKPTCDQYNLKAKGVFKKQILETKTKFNQDDILRFDLHLSITQNNLVMDDSSVPTKAEYIISKMDKNENTGKNNRIMKTEEFQFNEIYTEAFSQKGVVFEDLETKGFNLSPITTVTVQIHLKNKANESTNPQDNILTCSFRPINIFNWIGTE